MSIHRPKKKAIRDEPLFYDEKKIQKAVLVTPSTWEKMKTVAQYQGISVSELVERWGRQLQLPEASSHP